MTYTNRAKVTKDLNECLRELSSKNYRTRTSAAKNISVLAIGALAEHEICSKSTLYPLITLLADRNIMVRSSAAFSIGCLAKNDIFDSVAVKTLTGLLSDKNHIVRKNAAQALTVLNEKGAGGINEKNMVQHIHNYGDNIGTQVKDSFVYKSSINDDAKTCPSCGCEVGEDEQFCTECGERLI